MRTRLIVLAILLAAPALAQSPAYHPPRTPDGHPDFQGNWTTRWTTPLERAPEYTSLVISAEDGAKLHDAHLKHLSESDPLGADHGWDFTGPLVIRGETRSSLVVDPPDGRLPYTDQGRAIRAAFRPFVGDEGPEQRGLNERCLMGGSGYAPFLSIPAGNLRQIVETRDSVVILSESFAQLRIIPIDGRKGPAIPRGGSSSGRWDGDTLVVETTGFLKGDRFRFSPTSSFPITPATRITERFVLIGADDILYRYTVEDPAIFTRAWTAESLLKRSADRVLEFACHEGNYGLVGILAGARAAEKRAALKAKTKP